MLHDIAVVYCLSISEGQVGLSNDLVDTFLAMSAGRSDTSGPTGIVHANDSLTEMLHVTVLLYCSDNFLYMYLDINS